MVEKDFCLGVKMNLLSQLQKMDFIEVDNPVSTQNILKEPYVYCVHPTIIYLIEAKTDRAKKLVKPFYNKENQVTTPLNLNWEKTKIESTGIYNIGFILDFLKFLEITEEFVRISMKTDYPIKIETDDFKLILAPRIED